MEDFGERFDSVERRIVALEHRMDARFEAVDRRSDSLERRFDALERRVDARVEADPWLERTHRCFDALEQKLSRQFRWLVGLSVLELVSVNVAIWAVVFWI